MLQPWLFASLSALEHHAAARASAVRFASAAHGCVCTNTSLCAPIGGPPVFEREVFGYNGGDGSAIDFSRVTTVAWPNDPQLVCAAHARGARVVMAAPGPEKVFGAPAAAKAQWVAATVAAVQAGFFDGVTFDYEQPAGSALSREYADLIALTRRALRLVSTSYQVSTAVAWSPDAIDGRDYDMRALAAASDLLFVMDYDTRSQVFGGPCVAAANAPLAGTVRGLQRYLDSGISPRQMILGVPWYGYRYECEAGTPPTATYCPIPLVPFRGVNCSDAAGSEVGYHGMQTRLAGSTTGRRWDDAQRAPWFNTREKGGGAAGGSAADATVQYWYDDVQSLAAKYALARSQGLRGVGPYSFYNVEAPGDPMYAAFDAFLR